MLATENRNIFVLKIKKETLLADLLMFLGLMLEFLFKGTIVSQTGFICTLAAGVLCLIQYRPTRIKLCSFTVFYALLILYFLYRIMNGDSVAPTVSQAYLQTMCYCLIFMFFSYQYITRRTVSEITTLLSLVCIMVSLYLIFTGAIFNGDRLTGSRVNVNEIGGLFAFTVLLIVFPFLSGQSKMRSSSFIMAIWFIFIIILTGSRASLFMCFAPMLLYYLFQQKRKIIIRSLVVIVAIVVMYLIVMNVEVLYNLIGARIEAMLEWFITGKTDEASMTSRAHFIEIGMNGFKQRPWTGLGLFSFSTLRGSYGTYSHNNYVEMLVSGGIPAFVLFYLPFVMLIVSLFIKQRKDKTMLFFLIFIVCELLMHVATIVFYTRINLFIYLFVFASCARAGRPYDRG